VQFVDGVHHITFLTEDMDPLIAFYEHVFDAEVTLDMTGEGLRHMFLKVGPTTVRHDFQMLEGPGPPPPSPLFSRGRLDHPPPAVGGGVQGAAPRRGRGRGRRRHS
jgi:catechol 2,3-dioxygenase-like lactoylglutathione lyase family enzyme